jgi:ATP-binding cassette, subfamily C, bacterial
MPDAVTIRFRDLSSARREGIHGFESVRKNSMRLMLRFARAYPRHTLVMLIALLLAGVVEGISLTALLPMLNLAVGGGAAGASGSGMGKAVSSALRFVGLAPTLASLLMIVAAGVFLKSALVLVADRKVGYTVAHVATDLRLALLRALLGTRWEYYLSQPMGSLANSAATEVMRASQAYLHGSLAITYLVQAVVYAAVALLVSWRVSAVSFAAGCLLLIVLDRLVRTTKKAGRRETHLLQSLLARLTDSLQSVKPLKAMGREQLAEVLLETDAVKLNHALRKQVYSKAVLKSLQEPMLMLMIIAGLYATLILWKYELPTVMVLIFLMARLLKELGKVQRSQQDMAACESAFWSLQQKIDEAERQKEVHPGCRKVVLENSLRFDRVSFSYGALPVLKGVSLEIPAGSFTAVIGASGAGKTTLVDLVSGLLRPQDGEVLVDDVPMVEMDVRHWRRQIGYVPQDTVLLHDSILANVTLGDPALSDSDAEEALRAAGAWDFVAGMEEGLRTVVGERGSKLSGGERQRIAIARALAHRPTLLILDEATSALDLQSEKAICRTLAGLRGRITMLAISHRAALVEAADRIYRIQDRTAFIDRLEPGQAIGGGKQKGRD